MNVTDNLKQVLAELPSGVRLVAVSKFHPNEAIEEAYRAGQTAGRSEQTSHKGRKSYSLFTANTHRSRRNQVWFQF